MSGIETSISSDFKINYKTGVLSFEDQIVITGAGGTVFSMEGDSGSLIVERQTKQAIALLIAGSSTHTIANHLDEVLNSLQVTLL